MEGSLSSLFNILSVLVLVGLNGFFVAAEFALVSVRRTRVEELLDQGKRGSVFLSRAVSDLDRYIAGTQVGITLASLGLGWIGEPAFASIFEAIFAYIPMLNSPAIVHTLAVISAFLTITVLHVVLGELIPKSIALQKADSIALAVSAPMSIIILLFQPLIWSLNGLGNRILKYFGIEPSGSHQNIHSVDELEILVRQSHEAGVLDDLEQDMLQRTFRFAELTVGDIMIRRLDMIGLDIEKPVEQLIDESVDTIHSRLPVYEGTMDVIVGILHTHDLFKALRREGVPKSLRPLCRPALFVPKGIHLDMLLKLFQEHRTQIAVVVDEYGGTAGLVTFEDLVEEVTGEVSDELEASEPSIQQLKDGRIILQGNLRLDEVSTALNWDIQDDSVDTIAGYIMKELGRVAKVDDEIETSFGKLKVIDMARMRITRVSATPKPVEVGVSE